MAINLLFGLLILCVLRSLFCVAEKINLLVACCQVDLFCYLNWKSYLNWAACFYSQVHGHIWVPFESHRRSSCRLEKWLWSMSMTPAVSGCGWLQQLKLESWAWHQENLSAAEQRSIRSVWHQGKMSFFGTWLYNRSRLYPLCDMEPTRNKSAWI